MAELINGREIAKQINASLKERIGAISVSSGKTPKLASISVGKSEDAEIYVHMQKKTANSVGIDFETYNFEPTISEVDLLTEIAKLNSNDNVTSIIIQKPLPEGISHSRMISNILPQKDAEGLHPYNLGKILRREADILPSTPGAIMKILKVLNIDLYGKEVVVVGHSAIVGKPLSLMLLNEMATTTVCHIATCDKGFLKEHTKNAEILIVAVGKAQLVKGDWIKEGAIVIDVGINKMGDNIVGDVDFEEAKEKASAITPVPGGVGPVTVSILMRNVYRSFRKQNV